MSSTAAYYTSGEGAAGNKERRGRGLGCTDGSFATSGISRGLHIATANHHTRLGDVVPALNG